MFQNNNSEKLQAPKDSLTPKVVNKVSEKAQKAGGKVKEAGEKISHAQSLAGNVQNSSAMFMNQNMQSNVALTAEGKVWTKQPTSKIHNATAISTSQILGINRVVKLEVIIEGKQIQHFKHFKLDQSAVNIIVLF